MNLKNIIKKLKADYLIRGYAFAGVSFIANTLFFCYNFFIGIFYRLIWNFSVSFYYLLLSLVKAGILHCERKWEKQTDEAVREQRIRLFKRQSVFLLLIDVALIAPIALLLLHKKTVQVGKIPAIAVAAYTTYKIVMAFVQYKKVKKKNNLSLQALKTIHLKETIVSVITLENTMINVFGDPQTMLSLSFWTSTGLWLLVMCISVISMKTANALK